MVEMNPSPPNELNAIPSQDSVIIHRLFDSPPSTLSIKPITGGETNKNYKVDHENKLFVVRIPYEGSTVVDRDVESRNIRIFLNSPTASVMPHYEMYVMNGKNIIGSSTTDLSVIRDGTAVTRYIKGKNLTTALLRDKEVQKSLVRTLRTLHLSGVELVNEYDPFNDDIAGFSRIVRNSGQLSMLADVQTVDRIDEITRLLEVRLPVVDPIPTHNDLVFGNLRMDDGVNLFVLDPEYAGQNKRGLRYDFGTLLGENVFLDDPLDKEVLGEILEEASSVYEIELDPEIVHDAAMVNMIVTFWWGGVQYVQAPGEEKRQYFAKYVAERIEEIN